jgi:hypothetical protein
MTLSRKAAALWASAVMALGVAVPAAAVAGDYCPPKPTKEQKCNAGRGNGSEGCDPGNSSTALDGSAGQNQGGDEGGPVQGGTAWSRPSFELGASNGPAKCGPIRVSGRSC